MACNSALVQRAAMTVKSANCSQYVTHDDTNRNSQATGANLRMYSRSCPPSPSPLLRLDRSTRIGIVMMGAVMARAKAAIVEMRSHRGPHAPCFKDEVPCPRFGDWEESC